MSERIGFLEESPGVRSSTRLAALAMVAGCLALVAAIVIVAIWRTKDAPPVIAAIGAALLPLAGGTWAALKVRSSGGDAP